MNYIKNPAKIEKNSFIIIQDIIEKEYPNNKFNSQIEEKIIKRCIHTSADFDYLEILKINKVNEFKELFSNGNFTIFTDTNMALSGINKNICKEKNINVKCFVAEELTANIAKEKCITRSMAAVESALKQEGLKIFVFGNAPTALFYLLENLDESVKAIIGVPVGFVGASESKEELEKHKIPHILSKGRKGGSNIAAAIVNAILYDIKEDLK